MGAYLLNLLSPTAYCISHWRQAGHEVDFVVQRGDAIWAIEVKSGGSRNTGGLSHFRQCHPESRSLIIGGNGIPLETFFETPPAAILGA